MTGWGRSEGGRLRSKHWERGSAGKMTVGSLSERIGGFWRQSCVRVDRGCYWRGGREACAEQKAQIWGSACLCCHEISDAVSLDVLLWKGVGGASAGGLQLLPCSWASLWQFEWTIQILQLTCQDFVALYGRSSLVFCQIPSLYVFSWYSHLMHILKLASATTPYLHHNLSRGLFPKTSGYAILSNLPW